MTIKQRLNRLEEIVGLHQAKPRLFLSLDTSDSDIRYAQTGSQIFERDYGESIDDFKQRVCEDPDGDVTVLFYRIRPKSYPPMK